VNVQRPPATIHASAVAVGDHGILIRGETGSGKSSLALALIDDPRLEARLVGDDRIVLSKTAAGIVAQPPGPTAGMIEIRGIGIMRMPYADAAQIALVVDLLPLESCPRMPDEGERNAALLGRQVPRLALPIGAVDGVLRVRTALQAWTSGA
jgi:HPr kinase/phosphorylase